jgi:hypothetical protein
VNASRRNSCRSHAGTPKAVLAEWFCDWWHRYSRGTAEVVSRKKCTPRGSVRDAGGRRKASCQPFPTDGGTLKNVIPSENIAAEGRQRAMTTTAVTLSLHMVPELLRAQVAGCFETGDGDGFVFSVDNTRALELVVWNTTALQARGLYERALLQAWTGTRTNHHGWSLREQRALFEIADRRNLRAVGDPLPKPGPFTLYRGVAGRGPARRIRGLSWTASPKQARWFAERFAHHGRLTDPAVYQVTVSEADVLAYVGSHRQEDEYLVLVPPHLKPIRVFEEGTANG